MAATKSLKHVFWIWSVYIFQDPTAPTYSKEVILANMGILAMF